MQLLLILNLLATSFYFQSFFFLCFAVTFHFTFSFDLFFLLFFIQSLKNYKILSGSSRPPYRSKEEVNNLFPLPGNSTETQSFIFPNYRIMLFRPVFALTLCYPKPNSNPKPVLSQSKKFKLGFRIGLGQEPITQLGLGLGLLRVRGGCEWGYFDNTKHLFFWLYNIKQLIFSHFNTNIKHDKIVTSFFSHKQTNYALKGEISMLGLCLLYQRGFFGHFLTIRDYFKTSEE